MTIVNISRGCPNTKLQTTTWIRPGRHGAGPWRLPHAEESSQHSPCSPRSWPVGYGPRECHGLNGMKWQFLIVDSNCGGLHFLTPRLERAEAHADIHLRMTITDPPFYPFLTIAIANKYHCSLIGPPPRAFPMFDFPMSFFKYLKQNWNYPFPAMPVALEKELHHLQIALATGCMKPWGAIAWGQSPQKNLRQITRGRQKSTRYRKCQGLCSKTSQ